MAEPKDRHQAGPIEAERFVPGELGPFIEYEHGHRYALASQLVSGLRVLDLACGSGHGTRILRRAGAEVVALDLDPECARLARPSLRARAEAIPFRDGSFDAVVCFEAIEHVEAPGSIVAEIARVLRREGFALISTPDRRIYTDRAGNQNPHHLHEVDRAEFSELVGEHFRHTALYGQSVWAGSWIAALESDGGAPGGAERAVRVLAMPDTVAPAATPAPWTDPTEEGLPTPLFLIALVAPRQATFRRIQKQLGKSSVLQDTHQRLLGQSLATQEEIVARDATIAELNVHASNLTARAEAAEADSRNLNDLLGESEKRTERFGIHVANLEQEIDRRSRIVTDHEAHARNLEKLLEAQSERRREVEKHARNAEEMLAQSRAHADNLEAHARDLERQLSELQAHADNLEREIAQLREHAESAGAHARNLETELAGRSAHAGNLEQQLAELQTHVGNLERQIAEHREHAESARAHSRNLETELAGRSAHADNLEQQLTASTAHAAAARAELEQTRRQLDQIRARRWYRILRALGASE